MLRLAGKTIARLTVLLACLIIAQAAHAQQVQFRVYEDSMGFSCEFPTDWTFQQAPNTDRIFSGPAGSARDATIIIQVIDRERTAEKTAPAQLEAIKGYFVQAPDGRILSEGTAPIAAQQAPYLIAGYTAADTSGSKRPFRHIQMVVTAPRVFLLMSYSAPDAMFDKELRVFQNCAATLEIDVVDPPEPVTSEEAGSAAPPAPPPGSEETIIWRRNADRDFWIAVPSVWSNIVDDAEPYSVDMQHPDRVEGVVVWAVDMGKTAKVTEYADAWEQILSDKIFFMNDRLAVPAADHPGVGLPKIAGILREYQGMVNGATVRSVAAYVVNKKRGFTVVGFHFLGDRDGEKRIRAAVNSFRLAPPEG